MRDRMPLTLYSPSPLSPALRTLDKSPCGTGCHSRCIVLHLRHPHYALWTRVRAGQDVIHAVQSFTFVTRTTHPGQESVQDRMPLTLFSPSPSSPALRTLDKSPCGTGCHSRCTSRCTFTFVARTTHPGQESVQDRMPLTLFSPSPSSPALRTLDKSPCGTGCHSRCTVLHLCRPHYAPWTRVRTGQDATHAIQSFIFIGLHDRATKKRCHFRPDNRQHGRRYLCGRSQ